MGMFDSVIAACPRCDEPLEFQSKAGECGLHRYSLNGVPETIADSLEREGRGNSPYTVACKKCGTQYRLQRVSHQFVVPMELVDVDAEETERLMEEGFLRHWENRPS